LRDILITVQEAQQGGSLLFGVGVNTDSGITGSIILNERNFDIQRPPVSFDDLFSGSAFRGAGQELRIEFVGPPSKR
jgi:outer membrane protein insertion porin family